jgi:hypothetical protein
MTGGSVIRSKVSLLLFTFVSHFVPATVAFTLLDARRKTLAYFRRAVSPHKYLEKGIPQFSK